MSSDGTHKLGARMYKTATGRAVVKEELQALGGDVELAITRVIHRKQRGELFAREDAPVRGDIRELRVTHDGCEYRAFYSNEGAHGEIVLVLVVAEKKAKRIEKAIKRAEQRLKDWRRRGGI